MTRFRKISFVRPHYEPMAGLSLGYDSCQSSHKYTTLYKYTAVYGNKESNSGVKL
ncbi:MAG: hypothetical protein ACP5UF_07840 [Hydrogenobaculum sp.]